MKHPCEQPAAERKSQALTGTHLARSAAGLIVASVLAGCAHEPERGWPVADPGKYRLLCPEGQVVAVIARHGRVTEIWCEPAGERK
jgi:hypothetical protein